jgi:hypothetical protein
VVAVTRFSFGTSPDLIRGGQHERRAAAGAGLAARYERGDVELLVT